MLSHQLTTSPSEYVWAKFFVEKNFSAFPITSSWISVRSLKEKIIEHYNNIYKSKNKNFLSTNIKKRDKLGFDLNVYDADSKKRIFDEDFKIYAYKRVLLERIPISKPVSRTRINSTNILNNHPLSHNNTNIIDDSISSLRPRKMLKKNVPQKPVISFSRIPRPHALNISDINHEKLTPESSSSDISQKSRSSTVHPHFIDSYKTISSHNYSLDNYSCISEGYQKPVVFTFDLDKILQSLQNSTV